MAVLDLTAFDPMVKEHYSPLEVAKMAMQNNKAIGLLSKSQKKLVGGRKWDQPIMSALPGGGSSTFATAITNAANNVSSYKVFGVTRSTHYRLAKVDNQAIEATATGDIDAFESAFDEFDNAIEAEGNYMNFRFFRGADGSIGRMANTTFATTTLTFADAASVWGVRSGEVLKLSPDTVLANLRSGSLTVSAVQRLAGTVTLSGNISTGVAAAAANDYVILDGDFTLAASGLADWVPDSTPGATAFFGVDRTSEPEYLGGIRIDGTDGRSVANLLVDAVAAVDAIGGNPDVVFMNPLTFGTLAKQLEGKWSISSAVDYSGKKMANVGFEGFTVNLNGHNLTIYTDRCCPVKRIYVLTWNTWCMFSAGPAPNFLQRRAGSIIKVSEANDGYEARVGEYYNFACRAPGYNAVCLLP